MVIGVRIINFIKKENGKTAYFAHYNFVFKKNIHISISPAYAQNCSIFRKFDSCAARTSLEEFAHSS